MAPGPCEAHSPLRDAAGGIEDALHDDEVYLGTRVGSEGGQDLTLQPPAPPGPLPSSSPTFFPLATCRLCTPGRGEGIR